MAFTDKDTSLITILSSHHGRLRREQRDIDKRNLQKALKYGSVKRCWGYRWQIEYDGITFITKDDLRSEVTAYPSPLPEVPIDASMKEQQSKAKMLFGKKPELATSHTVLVIDNSGSMLAKKNKIHLYRDSQQAAFSITALDFVAEQLISGTAVNTDLVSLIIFSSSASVEFSLEPISWVAYNQILAHRNTENFLARECSPEIDSLHGQSNYLPALDEARKLLLETCHEKCALSLFFYSDGLATDTDDKGTLDAEGLISNKLTVMAKDFGDAFTVVMVGLGNPSDNFSILRKMANAAEIGGAKARFEFCNRTAKSMSTAISSLISSTTETKTALMEGHERGFTTRNDLKSEKEATIKFDWQYFEICGLYVYDPFWRRSVPDGASLPLGAVQDDPKLAASFKASGCPKPRFLSVNRNYHGKGAERVAFQCRLSNRESVDGFVLGTMVAKESKNIEHFEERMNFHVAFMETQNLANHLANVFNRHIKHFPSYKSGLVPRISFLACSILLLIDPSLDGGMRYVLVEKKLDTQRFQWTKWNDNNGMVDGVRHYMALDIDFELKQLEDAGKRGGLEAITEEDDKYESGDESEEESDGESDDDESLSDLEESVAGSRKTENGNQGDRNPSDIKPSDFLQAFTHFTYMYTNRKEMVCDLQGVFNTDMVPPTFELTDPVVHHASNRGRRMVYGRTDKGRAGHKCFLNSHKCTKICEFLRLSRPSNKRWKENWRQKCHI